MSYCEIGEAWNSPLQEQLSSMQTAYDNIVKKNNAGNVMPPWNANMGAYEEAQQKYNIRYNLPVASISDNTIEGAKKSISTQAQPTLSAPISSYMNNDD